MSWLGQLGRSVKTALYLGRSSLFSSRWSHGGLGRRGQTTEAKNSLEFKPTGLTQNASPKPAKPASQTGTQGDRLWVGLVALAGSAAGLASVAQHTWAQGLAQKFFQHQTGGCPTPVSPHVQGLLAEAAEAVGLAGRDVPAFVTIYVEDPYCFGSLESPFGCLLGYPGDWHITSPMEVDLRGMRFGVASHDQDVKLDAPALDSRPANSLRNCMILSDNAKRFALARELLRAQTDVLKMKALTVAVNVICCLGTLRVLQTRTGLKERPLLLRGALYLGISLVWTGFYFLLADRIRDHHELELDRQAASLGPGFCSGGTELYDKLLSKRRFLRILVENDKAKNHYSVRGDVFPGLIRTRGARTTARKEVCREVWSAKFASSEA